MKELIDAYNTHRLVIGISKIVSALKASELKTIILSKQCSAEHEQVIRKLAELTNTKIDTLELTSREMGSLCSLPFQVSVAGIRKEKI